MTRIALLILFLGLAAPALAVEESPPVAPVEVETADFKSLATAFIFITSGQHFKICDTVPQYDRALTALVQNDLRLALEGAKAFLADSKAFSVPEREQMEMLRGFLPQEDSADAARVESVLETMTQQVYPSLDAAKAAGTMKAIKEDAPRFLARLNAGDVKVNPDDLANACFMGAMFLAQRDVGPLVDRYRAYIKDQGEAYKHYRSTEGYLAARWGMTREEVAKAEGMPVASLKAGKAVRIDGLAAQARYEFTDGRLSAVEVTFVPGCKPARCLDRYRTIQGLLVAKYGPGKDNSWTDDEALSQTASILFEGYGRSRAPELLIQHGYQREEHLWANGESQVIHRLYSNKKPLQAGSTTLMHTISYRSQKFTPRADYLRRQQADQEKQRRLKNL